MLYMLQTPAKPPFTNRSECWMHQKIIWVEHYVRNKLVFARNQWYFFPISNENLFKIENQPIIKVHILPMNNKIQAKENGYDKVSDRFF